MVLERRSVFPLNNLDKYDIIPIGKVLFRGKHD